MERQIELENEMRTLGESRFRAKAAAADKGENSTARPAVKKWMSQCHVQVTGAIEQFMTDARSGKAGKKHSAVEVFETVGDPPFLAHLALRAVLDGVGTRPTLTSAALHLGRLIEDELLFRKFKEQAPHEYKAIIRKLEALSSADFAKERSLRRMAKKVPAVQGVEWDKRTRLLIGTKLIEIVTDHTGLIEEVRRSGAGMKSPLVLYPTDELLRWLETEEARTQWMTPIYMPCVIPPKPWTTLFNGGYHTKAPRALRLVKTNDKDYLKQLSAMDLSQVYSAVNALQETAWSINGRVLSVMKALWDARSEAPVIPQVEDAPRPARPGWLTETMKKEDMSEGQLATFVDWKNRATAVMERNVAARGRRVGFVKMLSVAERLANEEAIYFPHTLDFRGRIYPVPLYLQPQGNDAQRGLLTFANPVEINDEEGARWLAIHGAGLWGVDKVSFDERVNWVIDNEDAILAVASDPLAHKFWMDAEKGDKAWQALAFCFEWAAFKAHGYGYESTLPVQMDGSCNGLQNFSAILRDPVGGRAVNLVPSDRPSDIYSEVAKLVEARVRSDAGRSDDEGQLARGWVGHVDRKVCKRPVMTLAYGAKRFGMRQMVFDDTIAPWRADKTRPFPFEGSGFMAAQYLGNIIWDCVGQVVVAARAAMDWLQAAAEVAAKDARPIYWTTPVGFMVKQAYELEKAQIIELAFSSVRVPTKSHSGIRLSITVDSGALDTRRQANGVAPNWVHSLDAAHLMRSVNASHALGLRSYSMIHDSYGTHAGNAGALALVLREEFVRMYSESPVLERFAVMLQARLPEGETLPPLPAQGTLDLQTVLDSEFFFA